MILPRRGDPSRDGSAPTTPIRGWIIPCQPVERDGLEACWLLEGQVVAGVRKCDEAAVAIVGESVELVEVTGDPVLSAGQDGRVAVEAPVRPLIGELVALRPPGGEGVVAARAPRGLA